MTQSPKAPEASSSLHAVAALTAAAFSARGVHAFSEAVMQQVRQALPPQDRSPSWLGGLNSRLVLAARKVCLAGLQLQEVGGHGHAAAAREATQAREAFARCLETAAAYVDEHGVGPFTGDALRATTDSLHTAVLGIARRCAAEVELDAVKGLEQEGAPPALLFRLDGDMLWLNAALARVCTRREIQPAQVSADAGDLARELAARSRPLGGEWEAGQSLSRLGARTEILLRATLRRGSVDSAPSLIDVLVSEARRQTRLTPRELQVARLLVEHSGYQAVANVMGLSLDSVRTYVRRVYRKLAVNSQAQLRARLLYEGILAEST